jgi:hypothetical protein
MVSLPTALIAIQDQIIDHVHKSAPAPEHLSKRSKWYETDGWDLVAPANGGVEQVALNLDYIAHYKFSDSELIESQESEIAITDAIRVEYARDVLTNALNEYDGCDCPSVCFVEVTSRDNTKVVFGWLVEIHGQAGPAPEFCGAFVDEVSFYQHLSAMNFILEKNIEDISETKILGLWQR